MPRSRTLRPLAVAFWIVTVSPSRAVSSWITTVSAPAGITPPVKMRAAWPAFDLAVERMTGGDFADQRERDRALRHVGGAHGIAVHGRDRGRRLRAQRIHVFGEHAAERIVERNRLRRQRTRVGQHPSQGFGDRHQRTVHSVKSSAR